MNRNRDSLGKGHLALALGFVLAACGQNAYGQNEAVVERLNREAPPIRSLENQIAAVRGAAAEIEKLGTSLLYVGLGQADLQRHLPEEIRSQMADVTGLAVRLGRQELIVTAGFDIRLPLNDIRVGGEVEVHCSAAVVESALVLRPSVSRFEIQRVSSQGEEVPDELVAAINPALESWLADLDGAIAAQRIPLELRSVQTLDTAQLLAGFAEVSSAQSTRVGVDVALGGASVLIDPEGIHVLAEAIVLSEAQEEVLTRRLDARKPPAAGETPERAFAPKPAEAGRLAPCGLPDFPDAAVQKLREGCEASASSSRAPASQGAAGPEAEPEAVDFDALFGSFREAFLRKAETIDRQDNLAWSGTAIALSRRFLATGLNTVLANVQGSASLHFPHYEGDLRETILTPGPPDLKCGEQGGACESTFGFRPYEPRGCDSDCVTNNCFGPPWARVCVPGIDLACQGRKLDCERLKEQERLAYEAEKAAALIAWKVRKDACEVGKAATVAGCRINQEWLNLAGNQDVGEIRAHWNVDDGELHLTFADLRFGDGLDGFSARTTLQGGASLGADFTFVPHGAGNLVCVAQWSGRIHAAAQLPLTDLVLEAKLESVTHEADRVRLGFLLSAERFDLRLAPPPLLALLTQNPQIALNCPVPALVASAIAQQGTQFDPLAMLAAVKLRERALRDTFPLSLASQSIAFEIPARTLTLGGQEVKLVPLLQPSSLVLRVP